MNDSLMEAVGFSADDLVANRAGRLSEGQRRRLLGNRRRVLTITIAVLVGIGLVATTLLFLAQRNESIILNIVGISLTTINAVVMVVGLQSFLRLSTDANSGEVTVLSGTVQRVIRKNNQVVVYLLRVGGEEVTVPSHVFAVFEDGAPYRLYRTPLSRTLVAAEIIG